MSRIYRVSDFRNVLLIIAQEMINQKENLTEIDSKLGDGDMGMSMEKAALAIQQTVPVATVEQPGKLLQLCAAAVNRAAPSTLGTLLSFSLMAVGKEFGIQTEIEEASLVRIPEIFAKTIRHYGKANEGDKTILDALCPFARELSSAYASGKTLNDALYCAVEAADAGVEATKGRVAKTGRAKWLAERNMEYPDGGAYLCARVVRKLLH